ncbi:MAG: DUF748 domain-containing protein [Myxococcales bacterium]|nr:DUF748 domain-containing protein [Myxococcales bacterium]
MEYGIAAAHEAALHPPPGLRWYRQRWLWVLLAVTLVVVGVRIALNPVATALLHRALADVDGYEATFDPVQVSIIPLAMTVPNLVVVQDDAKGIEPIVRVPHLEARLRWRKLLRGQVVASASLERAKFVITFGVSKVTPQLEEAARKGVEEIKKNEFNFGAILEKVIPLRVDRIELKDCEFLLTDATDGALPQFWVSEVQLVVDNLVTRKSLDEDVPLMLTMRALVAKTGVLKVLATANLHAEKPAFTGQAQLDGLRLESLYSWTKAKAGLAVKGDLNVFVNFNSAEGKLNGDVKVIARNIEVDAATGKLTDELKATIATLAVKVLSDRVEGREAIATVLPLRGTIEKVDAQIWPTILGVIRNAFVQALDFGFGDLPRATAPTKEGALPQLGKALDKDESAPKAQPTGGGK